jgi:hypothetical protein
VLARASFLAVEAVCPMLQKTSRRTSARETHKRPAANQTFKECLDKFKPLFPQVSPDAFTPLDRIACDARATEAWSLIANHPEKANSFFFDIVDLFWKSEKGVRTRKLGEFLNDIEDAISACEFLGSFCKERSFSLTSPLPSHQQRTAWRSNLTRDYDVAKGLGDG